MKSLDQVDSFTKEVFGHLRMMTPPIEWERKGYEFLNEVVEMQSKIFAYGVCIVFMGFCLYKDTINSSPAP